jgi:hypothetical protein
MSNLYDPSLERFTKMIMALENITPRASFDSITYDEVIEEKSFTYSLNGSSTNPYVLTTCKSTEAGNGNNTSGAGVYGLSVANGPYRIDGD